MLDLFSGRFLDDFSDKCKCVIHAGNRNSVRRRVFRCSIPNDPDSVPSLRFSATAIQFPGGTLPNIHGTLRGSEALLQVILVPLCLIGGGIAIGFIIRAARVVH